MQRLLFCATGAIGLAVTVTCSEPKIRDCDLDQVIQDQGHDLDYSAVMPSNCPVPLGNIGEPKFIGANVYDFNASDYFSTILEIRNSAGDLKGKDIALFSFYGGLGRRAQPRADYAAATGYSGAITNGQDLPAAAKDRGTFTAILNSQAPGSQGRLTVSYRGANIQASVAGPDVPLSGSNGIWTASASGGASPYSYAWYRNGQLVGTSSSYSSNVGSTEFGLRLLVTDQTTASR